MSTKTEKGNGKFFVFLLALVLVAGAAYYFLVLNKQASAVMECNVNPNVQFVLDQNNKVMTVNYLNEDAEALFKEASFSGKTADEAAQLFVQLSTEAGFIDVQTSGTRVDVTISCEESEKYAELKTQIVNKVNEYFDEKGIIAGAVASVQENLADAVQKIGVEASELADKTAKEVLALYQETSKDLEGVAVSLHNSFFEFINNLKETTFSVLEELETTIADLEQQLESSELLPEQAKKFIKEQLDAAKKLYNENKKAFETMVDEKIEELKQASKAIFEEAKTQIAQAKEQIKQALAEYQTYYEQNKATIDQAIEDYRNSLVSE